MSLTVPARLMTAAPRGDVDDEAFLACVRESLPYAYDLVERLAGQVPSADRRAGRWSRSRRSWVWPRAGSVARPYACRVRPTTRAGRVRRFVDRHRAPDRSVWLPGRRRTALAGRARTRRGSPLQAGPGAGAGRDVLAPRGRRGASPRPAPIPRSRSAGSRSTRAFWRTWRTSNPDRIRQADPYVLPRRRKSRASATVRRARLQLRERWDGWAREPIPSECRQHVSIWQKST